MEDLTENLLERLQGRIETLVRQYEQLRHSNHCLQQGKRSLATEKGHLLSRQNQVVAQLENVLVRLRSLERLSP